MIDGRFKLVLDESLSEGRELTDLWEDPGESANLAAVRPGLAARLERDLEQFVRESMEKKAQPGSTRMTREQKEALRALGYVN